MSNFERTYQIDPLRESTEQRENHLSIELSDSEHLERNGFLRIGHFVDLNKHPLKVSREMEQEGWVYREPPPEESMSLALKEKFKKARKIEQDTYVIDLRQDKPSCLPMNLETPKLEKAIKKGKKNERKKIKTTISTAKKDNLKPVKSAVASVQAQL